MAEQKQVMLRMLFQGWCTPPAELLFLPNLVSLITFRSAVHQCIAAHCSMTLRLLCCAGDGCAVRCSYRADEGFLYPLDKGFFYIHKPAMVINHDQIDSVEFQRQGGGVVSSSVRTFDLLIKLKAGTVSVRSCALCSAFVHVCYTAFCWPSSRACCGPWAIAKAVQPACRP